MITEQSINQFLQKLQRAPNETLVAYSTSFEGLYPGDLPEDIWNEVSEEEAPQMRAAVRMGLVTKNFRYWTADFPDEYVPNGGDCEITLSGLGTEKLIALNEPLARKAIKQIITNLPTIIVSILVSLIGAWSIYFWGPSNIGSTPSVGHVKEEIR